MKYKYFIVSTSAEVLPDSGVRSTIIYLQQKTKIQAECRKNNEQFHENL